MCYVGKLVNFSLYIYVWPWEQLFSFLITGILTITSKSLLLSIFFPSWIHDCFICTIKSLMSFWTISNQSYLYMIPQGSSLQNRSGFHSAMQTNKTLNESTWKNTWPQYFCRELMCSCLNLCRPLGLVTVPLLIFCITYFL